MTAPAHYTYRQLGLAVGERHRREGVATALIGELRTIASQRDAYVIFVQADLQDGPAISLSESLGTKQTAHHFDIGWPHRSAANAGRIATAEPDQSPRVSCRNRCRPMDVCSTE